MCRTNTIAMIEERAEHLSVAVAFVQRALAHARKLTEPDTWKEDDWEFELTIPYSSIAQLRIIAPEPEYAEALRAAFKVPSLTSKGHVLLRMSSY